MQIERINFAWRAARWVLKCVIIVRSYLLFHRNPGILTPGAERDLLGSLYIR